MYEPPRPTSLAAIASLLRVALRGDGDLRSLLPAKAYRVDAGWMGYSRRSILIVNDPEMLREVMTDPLDIFPKSDLMVGALEPLVHRRHPGLLALDDANDGLQRAQDRFALRDDLHLL